MSAPSLTHDEARARGGLLTVQRYDIALELTGLLDGDALRAVSTVTFGCAEPGATTFVDCAADVVGATLNGSAIDASAIDDGRIQLQHLAADNVLVVESVQRNTDQRTGVHRVVDPTDGEVYVWTSFEPDEARRCWACFDQPDLKAPHAFVVDAPARWTVLSNTGDAAVEDAVDDTRRWTFAATPPLSPYVVVVNAGPFHERREQRGDHDLGLYCRRSIAADLDRDADELLELTAQGLAFFGERFGMSFPQRRYDQVFVPDLGGAMENYGCVTWSDDLLFRSDPSPAERELRAAILLHEMAHMWFGDIVTMRWWDDLWLNEAFANWACYWAAEEATAFTDAWAGFLATAKQAAYAVDRGPTTHPIRQPARDVAEASAYFDAITYVKGSSVLKQLVAYVGEEAFVAGLRSYFADHAWGNAELDDLMGAIGRASGRDLSGWTTQWLDTAGHDTFTLDAGPADGGALVRAAGPEGAAPRAHRIGVGVYDRAETGLVRRTAVRLEVDGPRTELPDQGAPADLLLLNDDDLTFASVRPDDASLAVLVDSAADLPTSIGRAVAVTTVWDLLLIGDVQATDFVRCATAVLIRETADSVVEPFLSLAVQAADRWAPADERDALLTTVADTCLALAEQGGTRVVVAARALARTATTEEQLARLRALTGDDIDLGWRELIRLTVLDRHDAAASAALLDRDPSPEAWTRALAVEAARPDPEAKQGVWEAVIDKRTVPSGSMREVGQAFWQSSQGEVLEPFAARFLDALPALSEAGMLTIMTTVGTMFPYAGADTALADRLVAFAKEPGANPLIARQVLEYSDTLRRMLRARGADG